MHPSEQETTMTWDSEQQVVRIFSARGVDQRRLAKAGILPTKDTQPHGLFYEIPLSRLFWKIRPLKVLVNRGSNIRNEATDTNSQPEKVRSWNITKFNASRHRKGIPDGN